MHIGIDLGTTYSCVSYIDEEGNPQILTNTENSETTPSVIWFDSKQAFVGKKANDRKIMPSSPIFEFVKRDIGKPKNIRYEVNGFFYGATGMSAMILRKFKKEAFSFFKKKGIIEANADEKTYIIPAVITVPAYFGDLQRQETRLAGYAAGLDVIAIINEPTAAAIAYGRTLRQNKKILVFDLGGGTFDVTILEIKDGEGIVIASDGADQLGGKDWDEIIQDYIYSRFYKLKGKSIPDDMGWEIQQKALQAKYDLTDNAGTIITISDDGNDVEIQLYRSPPEINDSANEFDMDVERPFYFEERSSTLLSLCRTICSRVIEKANLNWGDIDDIVLAGGSCRMPMIPKLLEEITGKRIQRNVPGFSYDTAIAMGAAIYGRHRNRVKDVTSKSIGIELKVNNRSYIEYLLKKDTQLPVKIEESFKADENAVLKIYEGESPRPEECILRGRLELGNPSGEVTVTLEINVDGVLSAVVEFPPNGRKELKIVTDEGDFNKEELKEKIHTIDVRL